MNAPVKKWTPPEVTCRKCGHKHRATVCPTCKTATPSFAVLKGETTAIWNSARGYSKPSEVVKVLQRQDGHAQIESAPDAGEDGPSFYWVPDAELTERAPA